MIFHKNSRFCQVDLVFIAEKRPKKSLITDYFNNFEDLDKFKEFLEKLREFLQKLKEFWAKLKVQTKQKCVSCKTWQQSDGAVSARGPRGSGNGFQKAPRLRLLRDLSPQGPCDGDQGPAGSGTTLQGLFTISIIFC